MLSVDNAAPFLLERDLIDRAWVIDGRLTIRCAQRRNRNLKVEGPGGIGFLVKQPDDPSEGGHDTLGAEAAFYRFCQEEPAVAAMNRIAPHLAYWDAERCLLALRLIAEAKPLWSYYEDHDVPRFPVGVGRAIGFALGTVHGTFRGPGLTQDHRLSWLGRAAPWAMMVHRPGVELLANLSPANVQTIRILQKQEGLAGRLDSLRGRWRPETVIHGDIRSDNVLVWESAEESAWEVRIVDWEMVQLGDPAWDLAGALQDFVGLWVGSMPLAADLTIEERVAGARCPLEIVQGAIQSLWEGYQAANDRAPPGSDDLWDRAMEFSAARLIQTAYEISYQLPDLSPRSVILLQIGVNILSDSQLARIQLYGIPQPPALR